MTNHFMLNYVDLKSDAPFVILKHVGFDRIVVSAHKTQEEMQAEIKRLNAENQ